MVALSVPRGNGQCCSLSSFAHTRSFSGLVHSLVYPLLGFSIGTQEEARHTVLMKISACKGRIYILLLAFAIGFTCDCSSETNYSRKAWVWVPTAASRMNSLIYNLSTGKQKVMIIKKKKDKKKKKNKSLLILWAPVVIHKKIKLITLSVSVLCRCQESGINGWSYPRQGPQGRNLRAGNCCALQGSVLLQQCNPIGKEDFIIFFNPFNSNSTCRHHRTPAMFCSARFPPCFHFLTA